MKSKMLGVDRRDLEDMERFWRRRISDGNRCAQCIVHCCYRICREVERAATRI